MNVHAPASLKRIDFTISGGEGISLRECGFVKDCAELPTAIKHAVEDFLGVNGGARALPLTIVVRAGNEETDC